MKQNIEKLITERTKLKLGVNKMSELARLVYEIIRREKITAEEIAKQLNTITYEVACGISSRVPRVII